MQIRSFSKTFFNWRILLRSTNLLDIIAATQNKVNSNTNFVYNTSLHDYQFVHADTEKNLWCVRLYVKQRIEFLVLTSENIQNEDSEYLWVEVKLNHKRYDVGVVYTVNILLQ